MNEGRRTVVRCLFAVALASGAVVMSVSSCASRQSPDPQELSERANQRLQGMWTLASFQPEAPLEPMLQGLLQAQFGTLQVGFDGVTMHVTGAGVNVHRRYQVVSAVADSLNLVIYDEPGIAYRVYGEFRGNELHFKSLDAPWRGQGILLRS